MQAQNSDTTVILGANSMLGWTLSNQDLYGPSFGFCNENTRLPAGVGFERLSLQDRSRVAQLFERIQPRWVIHSAGICRVDKCEQNPDFAFLVNVEGMQNLLDFLPQQSRLVYISSDHVFGGRDEPYDEKSPCEPISVYGRSRVLTEQMALLSRPDTLIVRQALSIGSSYNNRSGHLDWLRYRTQSGLPMTIVADEARSVVWASDAARRIRRWMLEGISGIRHLAASRCVSRPEVAQFLNQRFGIGASYSVVSRHERAFPHLGRVELASRYSDDPLPSVLDAPIPKDLHESHLS